MREYLEAMQAAFYQGPAPPEEAPIMLAALRPGDAPRRARSRPRRPSLFHHPGAHRQGARHSRSGEVVGARTDGAARARRDNGRAVARGAMQIYLGLPNYQNNLTWLGFDDADLADGGSDRLVDAIVAWGDEAAITRRIQAHYDAGADHVCVQPLRPDGQPGPDSRALDALAPARR